MEGIKAYVSSCPCCRYSSFAHPSTLWERDVPGAALGTTGDTGERESAAQPSVGLWLSRRTHWRHRLS